MLFSPRPQLKHQKSMSYFQAKVSFLGELENGTVKKITKQYLVDAMSFTETEALVIKQLGNTEELYFDSIAHSPITEIVPYGDTDLWFKCKVVYKDVDPDSGKEKKTTLYILVNANDAHEAYERCKDHLEEMLVPFEIPKVEETAICEIYQYEKPVPAGYKAVGNGPMFTEMRGKTPEQPVTLEMYVAGIEGIDPSRVDAIVSGINDEWDKNPKGMREYLEFAGFNYEQQNEIMSIIFSIDEDDEE